MLPNPFSLGLTMTLAPSFLRLPCGLTITFVAMLLSLLVACGGGGGGSDGPPPPPPDTTAPSISTVAAAAIVQRNVNAYSFTIPAVESGARAFWNFSDEQGQVVDGQGLVVNGGISGLDVSSLSDGDIDLEVALEDAAGNRSQSVSTSVIKDTQAPANYNVSANATTIDATNQNAFSFEINGSDSNIGDRFNYSFNDQQEKTISGSGTITSAQQSVTGLNIGALSPGAVTLVLMLSDEHGNAGPESTLALTKVSAADTVTLSGTITFDSVPHNPISRGLNYALTSAKPARGVEVLLMDGTNNKIDSGLTDADGNYSFVVEPGVELRLQVNARMIATGTPAWDFSVRDNTQGNALYALSGSLANTGTSDSVRDLHAASGWTGFGYTEPRSAGPFAILDVVYDSLQLVLDGAPNTIFPAAMLSIALFTEGRSKANCCLSIVKKR